MKEKKKNGRPPKYKEEYCEMLIEHMAKGYCFKSFGAAINVEEKTLYNWLEKYDAFLQSKKIGLAKGLQQLQNIGLAGMTGKIKGFNVVAWIFFMKNMHGWTDKKEVVVSELPEIKLNYNLEDE